MATHSSVLAWRVPAMEEPGGLPTMGSHRVGHNRSDLAAAATAALLSSPLQQAQSKDKVPFHLVFLKLVNEISKA